MKHAFKVIVIGLLSLSCFRAARGMEVGRLDLAGLSLDLKALQESVLILQDAITLSEKAEARRIKHEADLAAQGRAEVPASQEAVHYKIDTHGLKDLLFDDWGELYIDRRFLTADEMKRVKEIEAFVRTYLIDPLRGAKGLPARRQVDEKGLPVFRGFEDARYQEHDALIVRLTNDFNANKAAWCGGTDAQGAKIKDMMPALVKAQMIEESGGNGARSKAAWAVDPLQVNVPGDWSAEKEFVGLQKPSKRNEGTIEQNVRAAIMYLVRKGFSPSARPAAERPKGYFDGWLTALKRYNGRRDRTDTDRYYSEEYADKIVRRATNPDLFVPIEIKLAK